MTKSTFVDYVVNDLLAGFQGVRARAMFGGHGIYQDDTMFAIIVDDELYYKTDESNRQDFEKAGSEPFRYVAKGRKRVTMSYWKLPAKVMDDPQALGEWTDKAVRVSRTASKKAKKEKA